MELVRQVALYTWRSGWLRISQIILRVETPTDEVDEFPGRRFGEGEIVADLAKLFKWLGHNFSLTDEFPGIVHGQAFLRSFKKTWRGKGRGQFITSGPVELRGKRNLLKK